MSFASIDSTPVAFDAAEVGRVAPASAEAAERRKAVGAAEQFEALLIAQLIREMRKSIREISPEGSLLRDPVNGSLTDFVDAAVTQSLASRRAFGIADFILRQIAPDALPGRAAARAGASTRAPI
ncbi:peptidoglycan hydrolase [Burkholderia oklahomensis]|uniref:peptidoglycan hydrolase n=1 Tax=Burkholderia oklahomensis TaxID=342113 RepID=UPI00016A9162|nr:peptidoglycan hydrolase [Burkholderia oklahomensis]AJX34752.1 rod binding family protein [Burkholderia oklahomensis C6786]AOI47978.1 peptidoglycan hydrolase [Burkholderia oklahomensis C6786]KUY50151.1 peptidoglycan hydrolase [Burkholderia oklahomensis C6786]MBI0363917.1 peptidoglycan hydrolase [Burkholderia oklahomensis]SUY28066.1 peptidoglycan hydrolase [Burkholderia oklahomensis]